MGSLLPVRHGFYSRVTATGEVFRCGGMGIFPGGFWFGAGKKSNGRSKDEIRGFEFLCKMLLLCYWA
jgi:hypothetical protein